MRRMLKQYLSDNSGATAVEYGLIAALISVALLAGYSVISDSLTSQWSNTSTTLDNAGSEHLDE